MIDQIYQLLGTLLTDLLTFLISRVDFTPIKLIWGGQKGKLAVVGAGNIRYDFLRVLGDVLRLPEVEKVVHPVNLVDRNYLLNHCLAENIW